MYSHGEKGGAAARKAAPIRQKQKQETRARILTAARRLFASEGVLNTPTADIASAASISHGALFVHFRTRDDLLVALIDEFGTSLAKDFRTEAGRETSLRSTLERHLAILERHEDLYVRLVIEGPLLPERARANLSILQSAISFEMVRAAEGERRAGRLRPMAQHLLFNTWIGLVHYYLVNRDLFSPRRSVIRAKGAELIEHFLSLVSR
jgi:AcrR family transcriptional regulator